MRHLKPKFQFIYFPFLIVTLAFISVYTFLHWLIIQLNWFTLKEDILDFWLPFVLPWIPVLIWLRPRVKLLRFKSDGNGVFAYLFLATLAMAIPTISIQGYMRAATGKTAALGNISEVTHYPDVTFFTAKNYYIDNAAAKINWTSTITGKNNTDLNFLMYVAMPMYNWDVNTYLSPPTDLRPRDTTPTKIGALHIHESPDGDSLLRQRKPKAWLCWYTTERINNNRSKSEKRQRWQQFVRRSRNTLENKRLDNFTYFQLVGHTDARDGYQEAIKTLDDTGKIRRPAVLLEGHVTPFEQRTGGRLMWAGVALGIGCVVWALLLLFPKLETTQLCRSQLSVGAARHDITTALAFLHFDKRFWVTPFLLIVNTAVFIAIALAGDGVLNVQGQDLIHWGGAYRPLVSERQWWRLLTSIFLHAGLLHFVYNMISLLVAGLILEARVRPTKFLLIYLVCGVVAGIASLWWHNNGVGVGASGAIFGIFGAILALLKSPYFDPSSRPALLLFVGVFIGFNLLIGLTGNIDNAAHIAGLITGVVCATMLRLLFSEKSN